MNKRNTIKGLKLDENEDYVFQYKQGIFRVTYCKKKYMLEKRINGNWSTLIMKPNKADIIRYVV